VKSCSARPLRHPRLTDIRFSLYYCNFIRKRYLVSSYDRCNDLVTAAYICFGPKSIFRYCRVRTNKHRVYIEKLTTGCARRPPRRFNVHRFRVWFIVHCSSAVSIKMEIRFLPYYYYFTKGSASAYRCAVQMLLQGFSLIRVGGAYPRIRTFNKVLRTILLKQYEHKYMLSTRVYIARSGFVLECTRNFYFMNKWNRL